MGKLLVQLEAYIHKNIIDAGEIAAERKALLEQIAQFIAQRIAENQPAALTFICTHNSRRSHLSQIWAQLAAQYFDIPNVATFSGGTEATAFNPRAVLAIEKAGFSVEKTGSENNPDYLVRYAEDAAPMRCFSKTYNDNFNPQNGYCAVMTCSDADEACPIVFGAAARIPLRYDDPKAFDGTPLEAEKYAERSLQIARELFWAMRFLRDQLNKKGA